MTHHAPSMIVPPVGLNPESDFMETVLKTYSDPRVVKALRKAFQPQSELERLQELDEENGE